MSSLTHRIAISAAAARSVAIAALLSITFLSSPLAAARADGAASAPAQTTFYQTAAEATHTQRGTVEQWITGLHAALKITPAEESKWDSVAQAMRENPALLQELAAGRFDQVPQGTISSVETLYNSMSDPQKKVADQLFQSFGREDAASYCQCFGSNRW
jgi:protein CpxP